MGLALNKKTAIDYFGKIYNVRNTENKNITKERFFLNAIRWRSRSNFTSTTNKNKCSDKYCTDKISALNYTVFKTMYAILQIWDAKMIQMWKTFTTICNKGDMKKSEHF